MRSRDSVRRLLCRNGNIWAVPVHSDSGTVSQADHGQCNERGICMTLEAIRIPYMIDNLKNDTLEQRAFAGLSGILGGF